jgi:hypothetical protein
MVHPNKLTRDLDQSSLRKNREIIDITSLDQKLRSIYN